MIAAHGLSTAFLMTVHPVHVVLLPAPVMETTWEFTLVEKMLNPIKKNITKL
jgi:hypothetical protein